jgi:Phosphotransferase enzyme family
MLRRYDQFIDAIVRIWPFVPVVEPIDSTKCRALREPASVSPTGDAEVDAQVRAVAEELGLSIIRPFTYGSFGAVPVATSDGREQVLKTATDPALEPVWTLGADTAARLHEQDYLNPRIVGVGATRTAVWSLQERVAGHVPHRLTATQAAQLVALAGRHNMDSGRRRPWRDDAIRAARRWLAETSIDPASAAVLVAALDRGEEADIFDHTVVHGDFHHGNTLIEEDDIVAVLDWDIAGPGDWRCDLVMLAFGCVVRPQSCEPAAATLITDAVRSECPSDVAALMMACQVLRMTSMLAVRSAVTAAHACSRMVAALHAWIV